MARLTKLAALELKITKAEERILSAKQEYESATADLKSLLDEKKRLQTEQLLDAIDKSGKSYEEVLRLINL